MGQAPGQGDAALQVNLGGVSLANPVMLAAGTCGTLDEMGDCLDLSRVGGLVTKSITPLGREGNATWRIIESRAGMLNAIGLANVGLEEFLEHVAPRIRRVPTAVLASVAGFSIDDYVRVAASLSEVEGVRGVELNVSCPNVHSGTEFGLDPGALRELVGAVRATSRGVVLVKLSPIAVGPPGWTMVDIARAALDAGATGLTLCNTTPAMAIDIHTRRPRLANVTGGLSGPAVHPVVVRLVHEVHRKLARDRGAPIVAVGGVLTWEDAAEFILAGASAVQVGTGLFVDPRCPLRIARGLRGWARRQGRRGVSELVGGVRLEE